jgi:long-chain acyl-CoA synthetase
MRRLAELGRASVAPGRTAIGAGTWKLTYGELDARSDRVAAALAEHGYAPGERIVLLMPSTPDFVTAYLGGQRAGLVTVPINPLVGEQELAQILAAMRPRAIVAPAPRATPFPAIQRLSALRDTHASHALLLYVDTAEDEAPGLAANAMAFSALQKSTASVPSVGRDPGDEAAIFFTSGTSGKAKGVSVSEQTLLSNANAVAQHLKFSPDDVILSPLPFSHVFGQVAALLAGLTAGARIETVRRPTPDLVYEAMTECLPTHLFAVPTTLAALTKIGAPDPEKTRKASARLRVAGSGGAGIAETTAREFSALYGAPVLQGYGMTETGGVISFAALDGRAFTSDVGRVLPAFKYRIEPIDPANPRRGELQLSGSTLLRGYYVDGVFDAHNPDDWFGTGDLVEIDAEERLTIFDRKKELILRGGYNVYPSEVEQTLTAHPAVAIAAVVGVPHEELGQEIAAFVLLKPGSSTNTDELIDWCRQRLALYKYPRIVKIVSELPLTPTGKVLKRQLPVSSMLR